MCLFVLVGAQVPALARLRPQGDSRSAFATAKSNLDAALATERSAPTKKNGRALDVAYDQFNSAAAALRADLINQINALGAEIKAAQNESRPTEELDKQFTALVTELRGLPTSRDVAAPAPVVATEVEPNNTTAAANGLALGPSNCTIVDGSINPVGDVDFFKFTTTAANARVWAYVDTGLPQSPLDSRDAQLRLFQSDGTTLIEFDDDDGTGNGGDGTVETGLASSIAGRTLATPGTYYLRVNEFSDDDTISPYRLFVVVTTGAPTAESEPNDTAATADPLVSTTFPAMGVASGSISPAGDNDYYAVQAVAGNMLFISLDLDPEKDGTSTEGEVALIAPDGTTVLLEANSASSNPLSEAFWWNVTATGTYYVRVRDTGNTATGTYLLMVAACSSEVPAPPPPSGCTIVCPANVNAPATTPSGAVVTYPAPTTSGTCGTISCTPASGSTFPIGTTTVTCVESTGTTTVVSTYSSGNLALPINDNSTTTSSITVTDPGTVADVNVRVRLNHTFDADIDMSLQAPNGTVINLSDDNGGSADDYGTGANDCSGTKTVFDDESAGGSITAGSAPFAGSFTPEQALSGVDGIPAAGTWTLRVADDAGLDQGTLGCWDLVITRTAPVVGQQCTFTVTVAVPFDICFANESADPAQRDVFRAVINRSPTDPLYGYYEYYRASTGERFVGDAETVSYRPGASLVMYDRDNPNYYLAVNANLAMRQATVEFRDLSTGRRFVLRDTNISDADTAAACAAAAATPARQ